MGLGEACYLRQLEMEKDEKAIASLRNKLQSQLQAKIPNSAIIARIRDKLAISTGSACSSATVSPSHVLRAMNLDEELIEGTLRIGIGKFTTEKEIDKTTTIISNVIVDFVKGK